MQSSRPKSFGFNGSILVEFISLLYLLRDLPSPALAAKARNDLCVAFYFVLHLPGNFFGYLRRSFSWLIKKGPPWLKSNMVNQCSSLIWSHPRQVLHTAYHIYLNKSSWIILLMWRLPPSARNSCSCTTASFLLAFHQANNFPSQRLSQDSIRCSFFPLAK